MLIWLSFVDPSKPLGKRFEGVAVVEVSDVFQNSRVGALTAAIEKAWELGCNPGGAVQSFICQGDVDAFPHEFRNRLLTKEEILENDLGDRAMGGGS